MTATVLLLAPAAYQQFQVKSGTNYTAGANGEILSQIGDIDSLLNAGCIFLGVVGSGIIMGRLIGANMNVTTDQAFIMNPIASIISWRPTKITSTNASVSLTTAAGGVYTAVSKGGTAIVASGQVYTAQTAASLVTDLTIATTPAKTVLAAAAQLYLSLTTGQGAAATADFYLYGDAYV